MNKIIFILVGVLFLRNSLAQDSIRSEYERGFDLTKEIAFSMKQLTRDYKVDEVLICSQEGFVNLYTLIIGFKSEKVYFKTVGEFVEETLFSVSKLTKKKNVFSWNECSGLDCKQFGTSYEFYRDESNSGKLYSKSKLGDLKNIEKFNCFEKKLPDKKMLLKKDVTFSVDGMELTVLGSKAFVNPESGYATVDLFLAKIPTEVGKDIKSSRETFEVICEREFKTSRIRTIERVNYFTQDGKGAGIVVPFYELPDKMETMSKSLHKLVHAVIRK